MCLVDIATGRLTLEQVDLRLGGPIPLELFRYYRSSNARPGDLGFGWGHPFACRLWREDEQTLAFLGGDGRRLLTGIPAPGELRVIPAEGFELERVPRDALPPGELRERLPEGAFAVRRRARPTLVFDVRRRLPWSAIVHASGAVTQVTADANGLPARLVDPGGRVLELERRGDGLLAGVSLRGADGTLLPLARYAYDERLDLVGVKTSTGIKRFGYDDAHRLVEHWNEAGEPCRSEFDAVGRCVRTHGAGGVHERRYRYDEARLVTVVTDGGGAEWTYQHNDAEQLLLATDPLGHQSSWDYDGDGRLVRSTDQAGHETTILFDAAGRPAGKVGADGAAWLVSERKDAVIMTSPCGAQSGYSFRDDGLIAAMTRNGRAWWRFGYGADGRVSLIQSPDGKKLRCRWSADARLLEESDDDGVRASYRFDLRDRLVSFTDAIGGVTQFDHDALGYLARMEHPDRTARRFEHDARGRITGLIDEAGNVTRWKIDAAGRRVACQAANSDVYAVRFDSDDRLTDIALPGGLQHRYRYDQRGLVSEQAFADGRVERYEWDPRGLPIAIHDASGPVIRAEYDAASRPVAFDYADSMRKEISYDADGRWLQVLYAGHRRRRELSVDGAPLVEWQDDLAIHRQYDELGRCRVVSDRLGQEVEYGYDADGHIAQVDVRAVQWPQATGQGDEVAAGRVLAERTHRFEYDRRGLRVAWHAPTGTSELRGFDARGRMTLQRIENRARLVVERRYRYDVLGRVIELTDSRRGRFRYRYDVVGRLLEAECPSGGETFGWTAAGSVVLPDSGYQRGQMITQARGWTVDYDGRGFMTGRRSGPVQDLMQYSSNGLLRRIARSDGSSHLFTYDGHSRLLSWSSDPARKRRFLWDREQPWAYFDVASPPASATAEGKHAVTWFVQLAGELQPIEQHDGVAAWTVHTDHNGRVCELIDADGSVAWENRAGVWGNLPDVRTGAHGRTDADLECLLGLPGQLHHPDTGLYYNRHRWYFSETAHYLTPDPSGLWGGFDAYAYAADPVNRNDPLGLQCRGKTDDPALYRADRRPPDQICNEGFQQWNPSGTMSLADHVNGSNETSPWISTTYNRQMANDASGYGSRHDADINQNYPGRAGPWVYEIVNPGCGVEVDCDPGVIAHAAQWGNSSSEQEIAFRKPIPPGNIVGAVNLDTGEIFMCP